MTKRGEERRQRDANHWTATADQDQNAIKFLVFVYSYIMRNFSTTLITIKFQKKRNFTLNRYQTIAKSCTNSDAQQKPVQPHSSSPSL